MTVVDLLRAFVAWARRTSTATSESDTEYDGLASYSWEWHALEYGLGLGVTTGLAFLAGPGAGAAAASASVGVVLEAMRRDAPGDLPIARRYIKQIRAELHYYLGAFVLGFGPFVPFIGLDELARVASTLL